MAEKITDTLERIEYKGNTIYYADYRNLSGDKFVQEIKKNAEASRKLAKEGESGQLRLLDIRGGFISWEVFSLLSQVSRQMKPYTKAVAVILDSNVRVKLLKTINQVTNLGARPFESADEAKEWLIKQS